MIPFIYLFDIKKMYLWKYYQSSSNNNNNLSNVLSWMRNCKYLVHQDLHNDLCILWY